MRGDFLLRVSLPVLAIFCHDDLLSFGLGVHDRVGVILSDGLRFDPLTPAFRPAPDSASLEAFKVVCE